jgi:hypothetical protein
MEPPPLPTPQQSQRMKEYSEKITKSKAEQVRPFLITLIVQGLLAFEWSLIRIIQQEKEKI